jgi:hypothetical protein
MEIDGSGEAQPTGVVVGIVKRNWRPYPFVMKNENLLYRIYALIIGHRI